MSSHNLALHQVKEALAQWPRVSLAHRPTTLEFLSHYSPNFPSYPIYLKPDHCTHLAMGGKQMMVLPNDFFVAES